MHSFIVIGNSAEKRFNKSKEEASKHSSGVDLIVIENPKGIESAREIKASLTRKPYQSEAISIILKEAQALTIEAQNALLKTLEEPPGRTQIYITAPTTDPFLPTVLSRCHIIDLGPFETSLNESDLDRAFSLWENHNLSKLFDATDLGLVAWTSLARTLLLHKLGVQENEVSKAVRDGDLKKFAEKLNPNDLKQFLESCQRTSALLKANVNRKLAMENLFLDLPEISQTP